MNRLKGGVDHSVKYRLIALESNPFDPELRERVDATIKVSASQYLLDISSLDDDKWEENFVEYIRKESNFWGGLKKVRRIRILEQLTLKGIRMILLFDLSGKSSIKVCQIVQSNRQFRIKPSKHAI